MYNINILKTIYYNKHYTLSTKCHAQVFPVAKRNGIYVSQWMNRFLLCLVTSFVKFLFNTYFQLSDSTASQWKNKMTTNRVAKQMSNGTFTTVNTRREPSSLSFTGHAFRQQDNVNCHEVAEITWSFLKWCFVIKNRKKST